MPKTAATCLYLYSALAGIVSDLHTYTDLGAIVHDNQGHDLSYLTFVNGALAANILIDTSQVATDTIDYVASDQSGLTSTSILRAGSRLSRSRIRPAGGRYAIIGRHEWQRVNRTPGLRSTLAVGATARAV